MRHLTWTPAQIDREMDLQLYEALTIEWQDAPPLEITYARAHGIKPYEKPITDPEEARAEMARWFTNG